jgi:hypothetical protein
MGRVVSNAILAFLHSLSMHHPFLPVKGMILLNTFVLPASIQASQWRLMLT